MASRAAAPLEEKDTIRQSCAALAGELLIAMTGESPARSEEGSRSHVGRRQIHLLWSTCRYEMRSVLERTERVHAHVPYMSPTSKRSALHRRSPADSRELG
jgi:hypothetical protein